MTRACAAIVLVLWIAAVPAHADHDAPIWPPAANALPVTAVAADAVCGWQEVRAIPSSAQIDTEETPVSGTVSTRASVRCAANAPVRVTIVSSLYAQRLPEPVLELVSTNTCRTTLDGIADYACGIARVAFGVPARLVATAGVTYELLSGGAWGAGAPPGCRPPSPPARAYCFVAADFRA